MLPAVVPDIACSIVAQQRQRAQISDRARQIAECDERNQERIRGAVDEVRVRFESDMARINAEMEAQKRIKEDLTRRVEAGERDRRELRGRANWFDRRVYNLAEYGINVRASFWSPDRYRNTNFEVDMA
jgi:hypothetical protein